MEYIERTDSLTIPANTGISGVLRTIKELLTEIPHVKELRLNHKGLLAYTWYAPTGAAESPLQVSFEDLQPYAIIRNVPIREVVRTPPEGSTAASQQELFLALFMECQADRLYPICFVVGADSIFWEWVSSLTGLRLPSASTFFGHSVLTDRAVPDDTLILCASHARSQQIEDTYGVYKICMEMPDGK